MIEIISDDDYKHYVDNNVVSNKTLLSIANKVIKSETLTLREKAIFEGRIKDINEVISYLNEF